MMKQPEHEVLAKSNMSGFSFEIFYFQSTALSDNPHHRATTQISRVLELHE